MMKQIKNISILLLLLIFSAGCNDYLDLEPEDELSEATMFSTYNNCQTFAWGFYESLNPYPSGADDTNDSRHNPALQDCDGDLLENGYSTTGQSYIWGRVTIPTSSNYWTEGYENIRNTNLMLDNVDDSDMTDEEKAHWKGVALFFRSFEYFKLLRRFGGVPWVEHAIDETDTDVLYGARESRDTVATRILRNLNYAIENIYEDGDGDNTINADCARALMSRFGLFEGTWRKYHNLENETKYLEASRTASTILISSYPNLMDKYDQIFNSESLEGQNGIILYRQYIDEDKGYHIFSTNTRSTNNKIDVTRKGIDMFLCKDGQTIWNSSEYEGGDNNEDAYGEFRNRDTRILIMTPPPYKVTSTGTGVWAYTGVDADAEWFTEMARVSGGTLDDLETIYKILPDRNWADRITTEVPNFDGLTPTQTETGYRFWKYFSNVSYRTSSRDYNDGPIFRMGEILVNHAEVTYELGDFDQSVADATINKLRERAEVADMTVASVDDSFDPTRDTEIDPVLWEIRRERGIELMGEGFRKDDLRRWKKMDYTSEPKLGRWIKQSDYSKSISIQDDAAEGYVQLVAGTPPEFPDYYYLYPLPSEEIILNPKLEQNPEWE